jgi:hypothetical protein
VSKFTPLPSVERLQSILRIDESSPTWLTWKINLGSRRAGSVAGYFKENDWGKIRIDNKCYKTHRIVWSLHNQSDPGDLIVDHINRKPHDNNPSNLRLVNRGVNRYNSSFNKNATGYRGVTKIKDSERWISEVKKDGKTYYLGCFESPEEAYDVYLKACEKLYGFIPVGARETAITLPQERIERH